MAKNAQQLVAYVYVAYSAWVDKGVLALLLAAHPSRNAVLAKPFSPLEWSITLFDFEV